ncbi:MAG: hypothetical protein HY821_23480 [Acidobacteria bacterium]|nr:hypothetical protein [Acidobacteriota bacterium]
MQTNSNTSRRRALLAALPLPAAAGPAPQSPDDSFRYRDASLASIFSRARKARAAQSIPVSAYEAIVKLLREEELALFAEVRAHHFSNETESNYWHRGRLKFPSDLQTESRLLEEGKDPAVPHE